MNNMIDVILNSIGTLVLWVVLKIRFAWNKEKMYNTSKTNEKSNTTKMYNVVLIKKLCIFDFC